MVKRMVVKYMFEGAKGTGKSTLCDKLMKKNENVKYIHFDAENVLNIKDMKNHSESDAIYFYDRGYLSNVIYDFVNDRKQSFDTKIQNDRLFLTSWSPLSLKDFSDMIDLVENKIIIMYASDYNVLFERINKRKKLFNKGATEHELNLVEMTNTMFYAYYHILKKMEEIDNKNNNKDNNKIMLIDICNEKDIAKLENLT